MKLPLGFGRDSRWKRRRQSRGNLKFKSFLDWTQVVANIFASLSVIMAAATYMGKVAIHHETETDKSFEGRWTNNPEGCIGCQFSELPQFSLHLDIHGNGYAGYIDTRNYVTKENGRSKFTDSLGVTDPVQFWKIQLCCVSLRADRFLDDINIEIYDYINGEDTVLGHASLKPVGADYMWVLTDINPLYAPYYPNKAWITHFEGGAEGSGKGTNTVGYSPQMAKRMKMIQELFNTPEGQDITSLLNQ